VNGAKAALETLQKEKAAADKEDADTKLYEARKQKEGMKK